MKQTDLTQPQPASAPVFIALIFLLLAFAIAQAVAIVALLTYKVGINAAIMLHHSEPIISTANTYAPIFAS